MVALPRWHVRAVGCAQFRSANPPHAPRRVWLTWRSVQSSGSLAGDDYAFVPSAPRPAAPTALSFVGAQSRPSRARESSIPLYVAGRRVNLLLALFPSALQIDPPPGSGELLLGFCARGKSRGRFIMSPTRSWHGSVNQRSASGWVFATNRLDYGRRRSSTNLRKSGLSLSSSRASCSKRSTVEGGSCRLVGTELKKRRSDSWGS